MMNMRRLAVGFQERGVGLLGRAAEAEVRRRLVVTALALERYRGRHGRYPNSLAGLDLKDKGQDNDGLLGQLTTFVVTNLCQFTPESASFDPELGAKFYARLPESNGTYQIELKSPAGERLRTISGSTSNGLFEVHWDLTDDRGRRCTNDSYDSVFDITLPGSGRSQTLRGP